MKLRIAKKIAKAIVQGRDPCYTTGKQVAALRRCDRTESARRASRFWDGIMKTLERLKAEEATEAEGEK